MKNFIQDGNAITVIAGEDIVSGQAIPIGDRIGVASGNASKDEAVVLQMTGVFEFEKSGGSIPVGAVVYLNTVGKMDIESGTEANPDGRPRAGVCVGINGNLVQIRIN